MMDSRQLLRQGLSELELIGFRRCARHAFCPITTDNGTVTVVVPRVAVKVTRKSTYRYIANK